MDKKLWENGVPAAYKTIAGYAPTECDGDKECWRKGSEWSTLFIVNGLLWLFMALNMACVAVGAYKPMFRFIGACVACPLYCFHFAMLIVTGIFRFRAAGALCALDESPNNYEELDKNKQPQFNDSWTYKKDGELIMAIWIIALICGGCCISLACGALKPPAMRM